ncbi:MAG: hypothetical protein IPK83_08310 [Planctomycetes bacterium]|nr:hypothetical protein [Planctomycetota bacterium]
MLGTNATRWSAIAAAIALAFTLTPPVFAGDDLATLVPDDVLLFFGHAGQKACDKMSKGTAWGDLRDEPEVKRFEEAIFTVIDQAIQKGAEEEKLGPVYRDAKRLAKAFYTFPTALAVYSFEMGKAGPAPVVSVAVFCRCGAEEADRMVKTVDQIFQRLDAPPPEIALVGASSLTKLPMPVGDGLYYGKLEDSFVLTVGEKAAKDLAARLGGKTEGSLAAAKCVTLGRKHIGGGNETRATMAYVNVAGALEITRSMMPMTNGGDPEALATAEKVITGLGLDTLDGMLWENHYRDGGCVSGLFQFTPDGGKGLFAASESKLTDDDLRRIPRNVIWASAFKFDLAGAYRSILAAVKEFPGAKDNVDQGVAMVEGMIGFKLDEEFLALLDDTWVVYDSRDAGGLFFTGVTLSIKVKDGEQFASRVETLIRMAAAQAPRQTPMGELRIETRTIDHREHKITFINVGGLPMAISPAWTLDGDHLIFGLYPQMVTSAGSAGGDQER